HAVAPLNLGTAVPLRAAIPKCRPFIRPQASAPYSFRFRRRRKREADKRDHPARRLLFAALLALAAGLFVAWVHPADRIKADLRADARGFVMSFGYVVHQQ